MYRRSSSNILEYTWIEFAKSYGLRSRSRDMLSLNLTTVDFKIDHVLIGLLLAN